MITVVRYRAITGDAASAEAAITDAIEIAVERLEDALDRPLEEAERTEQLHPTRDHRVYPRATPIVDAGEWVIDELALVGAFGPTWPDLTGQVEVTYTGGWVERTANPDATNRLPSCIEDDLAWAAYSLLHPNGMLTQLPAGATAVTLGDASVSFAKGAPVNRSGVRWSSRTLGYRYRVERGA